MWAQQRIHDQAKEHPCLVPYDQLTEAERQYDRNTAMETLKVLTSFGYRILPPSPDGQSAGDSVSTGVKTLLLKIKWFFREFNGWGWKPVSSSPTNKGNAAIIGADHQSLETPASDRWPAPTKAAFLTIYRVIDVFRLFVEHLSCRASIQLAIPNSHKSSCKPSH